MPENPSDFDTRLHKAKEHFASQNPSEKEEPKSSSKAMGTGLRAGVELFSGVAVGTVLGLLLDRWLGSSPWGLIILMFLGFAAGFLNIYRAFVGQDFRVGLGDVNKDKPEKDPSQWLDR